MHFEEKIFSSKISRRVFATFITCAIVPIVCLAILVYIQITSYLKDQASNSAENTTLHYRRLMRFIIYQMARNGFEVINPFTKDFGETEYNRVMERAKEDSPLAARELGKKYGVDIAVIE